VTLSCATPGAAIYYTTDGSTPTTASTLYTKPFTMQLGKTLKAIAVLAGYHNSAVLVAAYKECAPPPTYSLTVQAGEGGQVAGTASGYYQAKTPVSVTATANEGYHFAGWEITGATLAAGQEDGPAVFDMPAGAVTLTASFEADEPAEPLQLAGQPEDGNMYVGDAITLTPEGETEPQTGSTGWTWDSAYFDAAFNGAATFTAKQSGMSTITYTAADGQTASVSIGILEKEDPMPLAGPSDGDVEAIGARAGGRAWLWIGPLCVVVLGLGVFGFLFLKRRKAKANEGNEGQPRLP
jgi:hypothetical protein